MGSILRSSVRCAIWMWYRDGIGWFVWEGRGMYPLVTGCPVCGGRFHIERVACEQCQATLDASLSLGWVGRLSRDQLEFVRLLVKNRGNINGVAGELRVAYNTARSRMDDIVDAIGYETPVPSPPPGHRRAILDRVAAGEITPEEAILLLRS